MTRDCTVFSQPEEQTAACKHACKATVEQEESIQEPAVLSVDQAGRGGGGEGSLG